VVGAAAAAAVTVAVGGAPAFAGSHPSHSVSFFHGGAGSAGWSKDTSNDADPYSIKLVVPDATSYAGASLHNVAGRPAPAAAPSFDFRSTVGGPSGGSPRLVIAFSDGGNINLRPLTWVANTWTHEDGNSTDWDNKGGTAGCPSYEQTYATLVACHPGATVTSVIVVSDSGFLYPSGYTNYIDNISYDGTVITRPGHHGHGSDGDGHDKQGHDKQGHDKQGHDKQGHDASDGQD
jgi:hypothetical protein